MTVSDYQRDVAIRAYENETGRTFVPGEVVEISVDALAFAEYQTPWLDLDSYIDARCIYDPETNGELVWLVTDFFLHTKTPPIFVDILSDGIALVDGSHRTTAAFIAGKSTILAQLNAG